MQSQLANDSIRIRADLSESKTRAMTCLFIYNKKNAMLWKKNIHILQNETK